jgi:hypothetical protein
VGELKAAPPTVFRLEWPPEIQAVLVSDSNPTGTISNSDLECAGFFTGVVAGGSDGEKLGRSMGRTIQRQ